MEIVPRDQGFPSLVVHAIFYFEKFSETIESSNRQVIEIESFKTPYYYSLLVKVYPYRSGSWSNGFQKGKDQDPWFGSWLEVQVMLGHVRSSVSARNDILMFQFFFFLFQQDALGGRQNKLVYFSLSFLGVGLAWPMSKLSTWGSREKSLESRTRKETQVREVGNFSHARGHLRVSGVLLDGPRKNRDCSQSREREESSPFPPPLAASRFTRALSRHLWWIACWHAT